MLAELLVATGVREQLEPEQEERGAVAVLLDRRELLAHLPRGRPWGLGAARRHLAVALVDAPLEQLGEQLLLRLEVRVEGAARVAGLLRDRLDAGPAEAALGEDALRRVDQRGARLRLLLSPGQPDLRFHMKECIRIQWCM